jgi:histidinol-phosphate phosphatase family protein
MPSPSPSSHGRYNQFERFVFLDRDGVINHDSPAYIKSVAEFDFISGSLDAIAALTKAGFACIVITNQSAIGRGIISPATLDAIHQHMATKVAARGGLIADIFFCPHRPDAGCTCRKPRSGMLRSAARKYGIELAQTWMVGDSAKDIECARQAGCQAILVQTGDYQKAKRQLARRSVAPDYETANLQAASRWILAQPFSSNGG